MKDIFVSLEIAKKLKEVGFNEPCIAYYHLGNENDLVTIIKSKEGLTDSFILGTFSQSNYAGISATTYEQVFKWFREKDYHCYFLRAGDKKEYWGEIERGFNEWSGDFFPTYEQAREQTTLKLIELYEKQRPNQK